MLRRSFALFATIVLAGCEPDSPPTAPQDNDTGFARVSVRSDFIVSPLPLPPGALQGSANAVNEADQIVGDAGNRAILWQADGAMLLPGLGGPTSSAQDINDRGDIAGYADNAAGLARAVVWSRGVPRELGTLGGDISVAMAINNRGQIVGVSETAAGNLNAFLWQRGQMLDLGRLPFSEISAAADINDRGTIVGWSAGGATLQDATLWSGGEMIRLPTLGHESAAYGINARGHIVGGSFPLFLTFARAVLWQKGEPIDLGSLAGEFSSAHAINDRALVVGVTLAPGCGHCPFLWERGTMVGLPSAGTGSANDISNRGLIVGRVGTLPVLWTAESASFAATFAGEASPRMRARSQARAGRTPAWAATFCELRGRGRTPAVLAAIAGC